MLKDVEESSSSIKSSGQQGTSDRRKRINRIKTGIIIIAIVLLILPTIFCIILGFQVSRLQKQVDVLLSLHDEYDLSARSKSGEVFAYAAVIDSKEMVDGDTELPPVFWQSEDMAAAETGEGEEDTTQRQEDIPAEPLEEMIKENPGEDTVEPEDSSGQEDGEEKPGKYVDKKVYLTFDDGPSIFTDEILDILKEYDVKATFFVVGKENKKSKELYKRIVDEGHTLGMHSYSHEYSKIYNSLEDFQKDFTKLWKLLYDTTGYKPTIFRFPGGSNNMVNKRGTKEFIRYLNEAGIVYFDWNVVNGDATGVEYTEEQLIDNVLKGIAIKRNAIVLMHDIQTKPETVASLPKLLDILISEDARILPLDDTVTPIQMIKADTVK